MSEISTTTTTTELAERQFGERTVTFAKGKGEASANADAALMIGGKARAAALDEVEHHILEKARNGRPLSAFQYLTTRFPKVGDALAVTQGPLWNAMEGKGCKDRFAEVCQCVLNTPLKSGREWTKAQRAARSFARTYLRAEGIVIRADAVTVEG